MSHEEYMWRCIYLASMANGGVGINPNVGAVIVHNDVIIGEGYHQQYGGPHAEINAINSVSKENLWKLSEATLYVTLEPCNHFGLTPPCCDRILKEKMPHVVVGCEDPNPKMAGSSLKKLQNNGVHVTKGVLQKECQSLIHPFRVNITEKRPFVTLKFAQSKDFYFGYSHEQVWLSNAYSKIWSHQLRSRNHAILIGTQTALIDNPSLTNRLYSGKSPLRVVIDKDNQIPITHQLLNDEEPLLTINQKHRAGLKPQKEQWTMEVNLIKLLARLYEEKKVGRMIVEGGAMTIKSFIENGLWDQAAVVNTSKELRTGIESPQIKGVLKSQMNLGNDHLTFINKIFC
ncbi:bifunctional diaminohydroxyphosphoribosylaminopyrimidine deaminase/5-amino-6-(5-phosphoribosylamino)uracil reductase RibD [Portibacter marinus]|uniref:bifunctional diaminohydroxyphosphoribosylaminopyrimidine deaminase/5-amino-6-(5-phosphoribosylamino)uracil reductase RibD n=1 Tax=Portibacter marinus TaxID=2898660 RepID=UPI001EFFA537|nr:bifunctional diaminohydroxyphosphoribosylaminopyrimidine deaminase/5-amino-6-(5-phosphoribosylamino)uracil reductase RibD [Portibacter marinus]